MSEATGETRREYLTTRELAELLRIKERKVYDLASSGEVPCTRATGKLLFPRDAVYAWLAANGSGPAAPAARPDVFLGSHDPLLDWALKESACGLATLFDGSSDGLDKFAAGAGIATGMHFYEGREDRWNVRAVAARFSAQPVVLAEFCRRERGLIVAANARETIRGLADLRGRRVVPRQRGAGSQLLLEELLSRAGLAEGAVKFAPTAYTETDLATTVLDGAADAALGLKSLAVRYRLHFVPLLVERYDILVDRRAWFEPPFQRFIRFCRSQTFRERAAEYRGYDVSALGTVHYNA